MTIVSSLGETGLKVIYPADCQNEVQATGDMALLGHEAEAIAEFHYHNLEPMTSQNPQLAIVEELMKKYGQKLRKNHRRNFSKTWAKIPVMTRFFESDGALQYYSDDIVF